MAAASSQLSVRGNDGGVIPRACGHLHARTCSARKGCGTQRALSMAALAMVTVIIVTTITIAIVTITICTITGMSCPQVTWIDSNPGLVTSEAVQAVRAGDSGQWRVAGACAAALPLPSTARELTSPAGGRLSHVALWPCRGGSRLWSHQLFLGPAGPGQPETHCVEGNGLEPGHFLPDRGERRVRAKHKLPPMRTLPSALASGERRLSS